MKTSVTEIQNLCKLGDIILLQETWLSDQEITLLNSVHQDFYSRGISSMDSGSGILRGRPFGVLAILWRKSLGPLCTVTLTDDSRLMQIDVKINSQIITLLKVYLPYDNGTNLDEFQMY